MARVSEGDSDLAERGGDLPGVVRLAESAADFIAFASLVREYVASLPFALDFQDLEHELGALQEEYGPPGGCALLAVLGTEVVGCVALRAFARAEIAELKRMYLRPSARGRGLGLALGRAALVAARRLGYEEVRLDTVAEMVEAARVYGELGFLEIEAYRYNPLPTARFYGVRLDVVGPA